MFLILLSLVVLLALFYIISVKPLTYWSNNGIKQPSLFKAWLESVKGLLQLISQADQVQIAYNHFDKERYGGSYQFFKPILLLRDSELIKQMTVKDFDHFVDHNEFISEEMDPLWGKNLLALRGDRWREMRATLSPSFTSSKMRSMFSFMTECAEQFVAHFQKSESKTITVEFKDAFTRFANDVIASAAFGLSIDSLKEPENEFYIMGKQATNLTGFWTNMKFLLLLIAPTIAKFFRIQMFNERVSEFFRRLVKTNMESRENNGIIRPDMIHLLMEAKKGKLKHEDLQTEVIDTGFAAIEESAVGKEEKRRKTKLTDDDITAQALIFFFAGFESVSTLMCFTVYELAINPTVQSRLYEEVVETLNNCGGTLTYEALLKMKYFDMVISESLRKWPSIIAMDRVCVKPYTIEPLHEGEKPAKLKVGDVLWLPIYAIHRDQKYYQDPDRFDPERFSEENKSKVVPYSYIPFGSGPRSCIGNRFALLETKTILFHILSLYEITVVEKSTVPIKLSKKQFSLTSENGFWFGLKPRKANN